MYKLNHPENYYINVSFFSVTCILIVIFATLNICVLVFLRKQRIASINTTLLIKFQTSFDLIMMIFSLDFNFLFTISNISCFSLYYTHIYWFFTTCSVNIMILISVDRFICIVFPFKYKCLKRRHFYVAISIGILMGCFFEGDG